MAPCLKQLDADCFRAHPAWAKQAFAYRLVHLLTPKPLTKRLPTTLRLALIAPGVDIPPGVEMPSGVVVSPGAEVPSTYSPGDPVPSGVIDSPALPPDAQASGPIAPTYTGAWGPGPVIRPGPSPTGVAWHLRFAPPHFSGGYKMTWTGTEWRIGPLSSPATAGLEAQSPPIWQAGYRPTHIRITYTGTPITNFNIRDQGWHKIITPQNQPLASLQAAAFDWTYNQDIHTLHMFIAAGQTNISAIEFLPA